MNPSQTSTRPSPLRSPSWAPRGAALLVLLLLALPASQAWAASATEVSSDATFAFARAKWLADRGDLAEAEEAYDQALKLGGDAYGWVEAAKFQLYLAQVASDGSAQAKHVDRAAEFVNEAYRKAPGNRDVLSSYADVHWRRTDRDPDALSRTQAAFEILAEDGDLHALTSLAQIYLWQRRPGDAADVLIKTADLAPRNRVIQGMLVDALLAAERDAEAEEALDLLLELEPGQIEGRVRLAELRSRRGDHEGAVSVLLAAPKDLKDRLRMQQLLARELHLAGRHGEALEVSDSMLGDDPRSHGFYRLRMSILVALARYQDAIDLLAPRLSKDDAEQRAQDVLLLARLEERVGLGAEAEALLRKEMAAAPDRMRLEMHLALAGVLQRSGDVAAAAQIVEPMLTEATIDQLPVLAQSLAELWLDAGRTDDAVNLLDKAIERLQSEGSGDVAVALRIRQLVDLSEAKHWQHVMVKVSALEAPGSPAEGRLAAAQLRADALAALGRSDEAIRELAVGDEPPELRAKRLQLMLQHGRENEALAELDTLAAGGRQDDLLFVARVLQAENRFDRAVPILRRALAVDESSLSTRFMLGAALERTGAFDEASAAFESVLEKAPDHVPTLNYLGYMWAERAQNLDRALDFIVRAVAAEPDNGAYVDSLGWAYYQLGRYAEARQHLEWASRLERTDATVFSHLGQTYDALGLRDHARDAYRRALDLDAEAEAGAELDESLRLELQRKLEHLGRSGP